MKRSHKILIAGVLLLVLFGAAAVPGYRAFKTWRASQLADAALALLEAEGASMDAWQKANSAYFLAPGNLDAIRAMARVLSVGDPGQAITYWTYAMDLSGGSRGDRLGLARAAMKTGQMGLAHAELDFLVSTGDVDDAVREAWAQYLNSQGEYARGMEFLAPRLESPEAAESLHALYLIMSQGSGDPDLRQKGREHVETLATRDDEVGKAALSLLFPLCRLDSELRAFVNRRVEEHPLVDRAMKLEWLETQMAFPGADPAAIRERGEALFDGEEMEELAALGRWLNQNGFSNRVETYLPLDEARRRRDHFLILMDSLALQGEWTRIREILEDEPVPLENHIRQLFLARSYLETGLERRAQLGWQRVRLEIANDPQKLAYFADYAIRLGLVEEAREAYKRMAELPVSMGHSFEARLDLERRLKNTDGLLETLESMAAAYPDNQSIANDLAFVRLLMNRELEASIATARDLTKEHPDYFSHKITLALGLLRQGEAEAALDVFEGDSIPVDQLSPSWRVVFGAILRANGLDEQAARAFRNVDARSLLPEEVQLLERYGPGSNPS